MRKAFASYTCVIVKIWGKKLKISQSLLEFLPKELCIAYTRIFKIGKDSSAVGKNLR